MRAWRLPITARLLAAISGGGVDQLVADAAQRLYLHPCTVQFRPQVLNVHVDGARFAGVVVTPDRFEELIAGEGDAGVFDEGDEEVELLGAKGEEVVVDLRFAAGLVDGEIGDGDRVLRS